MLGFRSEKSAKIYEQHLSSIDLANDCPHCQREAIKSFEHWKIIKSNFPYDRIAKEHLLLVTLEHKKTSELSDAELAELHKIKQTEIPEHITHIIDVLPKRQSVPNHTHIHLIQQIDFVD